MTPIETFPFPDDPTLAAYAETLNERGHAAIIYDPRWRIAFVTDEMRASFGERTGSIVFGVGIHTFGPEEVARRKLFLFSSSEDPAARVQQSFLEVGPFVLFDTPGGVEELRRVVDPTLHDLVDQIEPAEPPSAWPQTERTMSHTGSDARTSSMYLRIRDPGGALVGTVFIVKARPGMSRLFALAATADLGHLDRMASVAQPGRRPAAVLMADLEASTPLARRLSTAQYFAFGRRLVRAADQCVIDQGGIVGRHAGDGIVAFFLAETAGSESTAARACIAAARTLRDAIAGVAERSGLPEFDTSLRFGLHWGATLYVGQISTGGRSEVTALGDEVNEAARIEACATGSRTLASKPLIERLDRADAQALGIDPDRTTYTPLADLDTATDKARRDAPSIAVCDI